MKFPLVSLLVLCTGWLLWTRAAGDAAQGAGPASTGRVTNAAIIYAVTEGDTGAVERYLRGGGSPMSEDAAVPLLGLAAWHGQQQIVKMMLRHGVDVNQASPTGWTALMLAAMGGHVESVETLLEAGADVRARTRAGATAASIAAERGHEEIAERLTCAERGDRTAFASF
jgi:ankyrin repeat protein